MVGFIVVTASVVLAIAGFALVQRFVPFELRQQHNDVAGFIYAVLGVIYAVLLAFVVIVVWQQYEDAKAVDRAEANALADVHALAGGLAEPGRGQVQGLARAYAEVVAREEWPLLARGEDSERAWELANRLQATAVALQPNTPAEQEVYSRLLAQVSELLLQRHLRLLHSEDQAPPLLIWLLVGGGVVTVSFSYLFGLRDSLVHCLMVAALTLVVAASLFLVLVLDFPYSGDYRLEPENLTLVLQHFDGQ